MQSLHTETDTPKSRLFGVSKLIHRKVDFSVYTGKWIFRRSPKGRLFGVHRKVDFSVYTEKWIFRCTPKSRAGQPASQPAIQPVPPPASPRNSRSNASQSYIHSFLFFVAHWITKAPIRKHMLENKTGAGSLSRPTLSSSTDNQTVVRAMIQKKPSM